MLKYLWAGGNWRRNQDGPPFPCCPVNRQCQSMQRNISLTANTMRRTINLNSNFPKWPGRLQIRATKNPGQNIYKPFHVLEQFSITTSGKKLDYIINKRWIHVFLYQLSNKLRFKILENYNASKKYVKCLELMVSSQPDTKKINFDSRVRKLWKINCKKSHRKTYLV